MAVVQMLWTFSEMMVVRSLQSRLVYFSLPRWQVEFMKLLYNVKSTIGTSGHQQLLSLGGAESLFWKHCLQDRVAGEKRHSL